MNAGRYLEWLVPGQSARHRRAENFLEHRELVGWVLLVTMVFFSSLAFTVLENAMSVIFFHRVAIRRRHFLVSAVLPYCYILFLARPAPGDAGFREPAGDGRESVDFLGRAWSLGGVSGVLLYLVGVGRGLRPHLGLHGDAGGEALAAPRAHRRRTAALLWELTRHVLLWYFATFSRVGVVYGSLTTAIVVLLSLEIARPCCCSARR